MIDLANIASLLLVGFGTGVLVGLTGVGGGAIMTPLLVVVFRLPPSLAIGTDLVNAALMKMAGAYQHWRQGTVEFRIVKTLALGSLPAALLGVGLVNLMKQVLGAEGETVLTVILAWTLILVAVVMIVRMLLARQIHFTGSRTKHLTQRQQDILTVLMGLVVGILVSLTSVGAGSVVMIFLLAVYPLSAKCLVGSDIVHAALLATVAAAGHLWAGNVDMRIASILLLGSLPGVLLGSRLSVRMPEIILRSVLAILLIFSGMRLILH